MVLMELLLISIGAILIMKVDALSMGYYSMDCPMADMIVKNTVAQALRRDPTLSAGLLRMHFHDCFIQVLNHHEEMQLHALLTK